MRPAAETDLVGGAEARAEPLGQGIVWASWMSTVVFAVTAAGDALGIEAFEGPAVVVALTFFGVGLVVWGVAFVRAVLRSTREHITLTGLFFLQGTTPRPVQVSLLGSLAVATAVATATAVQAPFGVMEPVLPLALCGLWGARHGAFHERRPAPDRRHG